MSSRKHRKRRVGRSLLGPELIGGGGLTCPISAQLITDISNLQISITEIIEIPIKFQEIPKET